jgi:hypothetical protein
MPSAKPLTQPKSPVLGKRRQTQQLGQGLPMPQQHQHK